MEASAGRILSALGWDGAGLRRLGSALLLDWPLRRSTSSWAGGGHSVVVSLAAVPSCSGQSEKAWSDNGKWSGSDSSASLHVTPGALIWFPTLRSADGSIILDAERVGAREYRISWVSQARGFDLKTEHGWLIRGYHSTRKTLASARAEVSAARSKAANVARASVKPSKRLYIDLADSLAAGNCRSMSEQFAAQVWRDIGASGPCAVRADVVIGMRDDTFTRRALAAATQHHA